MSAFDYVALTRLCSRRRSVCGCCADVHMAFARPFALLTLLALTSGGAVKDLNPDNWHEAVGGRRWLVYFALDGCKHCERLAPMMESLASQAPEVRVGRIDATKHNGIARTFGVKRFPTILLMDDEEGLFYEFEGPRALPRLVGFARGAAIGGHTLPRTLQSNVSTWWLLAEMLYDPVMIALKWSVGLALALKGVSLCLLRLLRPRAEASARARADAAKKDD